jgi:hypothetical protein
MKVALPFCTGFAGRPANIAICCRGRFAACAPRSRNDNRRDVGKLAPDPRCDDDDEIRSLLQVVLTREGFRVQEAKDAPTARRMLAGQGSVDLIILDIMMPGEDGLSFCQRLRETLDTPILRRVG